MIYLPYNDDDNNDDDDDDEDDDDDGNADDDEDDDDYDDDDDDVGANLYNKTPLPHPSISKMSDCRGVTKSCTYIDCKRCVRNCILLYLLMFCIFVVPYFLQFCRVLIMTGSAME